MNAVNEKVFNFNRRELNDIVLEPVGAFEQFNRAGGQVETVCGNECRQFLFLKRSVFIAFVNFQAVVGVIDRNDVEKFFQPFLSEIVQTFDRGEGYDPAAAAFIRHQIVPNKL